ncbi:MAG: hypothetical protein KF681_12455 [Bdellovibrionaceae bacterium]|nr:hypothetical protein [Pseudobdellovibrionaceae bacterium]
MNFALAAISTQLSQGTASLKAVLRDFEPFEIEKISSIYRRIEEATEGTLSSDLVVAFRLRTNMDLQSVKRKVRALASEHPATKVYLLSFNHDVILDPKMPLPHPDLHADTLILHCAAEIEGGFEHPVLGRSLQELVKSSQPRDGQSRFEFLSRGESLLSSSS